VGIETNAENNLSLFDRAVGLTSANEARLNLRLKDLIGQR